MNKSAKKALLAHIEFLREQASKAAEILDMLLEEITKLEQLTKADGRSKRSERTTCMSKRLDELTHVGDNIIVANRAEAQMLYRLAKKTNRLLHTTNLKDGSGRIFVTLLGLKGEPTDV